MKKIPFEIEIVSVKIDTNILGTALVDLSIGKEKFFIIKNIRITYSRDSEMDGKFIEWVHIEMPSTWSRDIDECYEAVTFSCPDHRNYLTNYIRLWARNQPFLMEFFKEGLVAVPNDSCIEGRYEA